MTDRTRNFTESPTPQAKPPTAGTRESVAKPTRKDSPPAAADPDLPPEVSGYDGPEPTRFGDWEHKGRCTDF